MKGLATALPLAALLVLATGAARAGTVPERFAEGVAHFQAGRFPEAAEAFRELAVRYRVDSPDVALNLGAAEFEAGRPGPAIAAFHRAVRLDPAGPAADTARMNLTRARAALSARAGTPGTSAAFVFGAYTDAWTTLAGWASPGLALAAFLAAWTLFFAALGAARLAGKGRAQALLGPAAVVLGIVTATSGALAWGSARVASYRVGVVLQDGAALVEDVTATEGGLALPEGLEVRVLESRGGWNHVRLSSGGEGWLPDRALDIP